MEDVERFQLLSPSSLKPLIGNFAKISMSDNSVKQGVIYSIDPVTFSVVIVEISEENIPGLAHFVSGHAIKSVLLVQEEERRTDGIISKLNKIFDKKSEIIYTEDELVSRKKDLQEWLEKNRIPVSEESDGVLSVMDVLFIDPPYDKDSCRSTNEIVLSRIQKLVSTKPV